MKIYLIEKLHVDPYGSQNPDSASSYEIEGFLKHQTDALKLLKNSKRIQVLGESKLEYRSTEVDEIRLDTVMIETVKVVK